MGEADALAEAPLFSNPTPGRALALPHPRTPRKGGLGRAATMRGFSACVEGFVRTDFLESPY
jgi:hypothetical protein